MVEVDLVHSCNSKMAGGGGVLKCLINEIAFSAFVQFVVILMVMNDSSALA